ncbi:MAG: DUF3822 family protein [Bacteroidota bacterium]
MGLVKYDIKEQDFDHSKSDQYELSILFGMDSFAYLVRRLAGGAIAAFRSVELVSESREDYGSKIIRAVHNDDLLRLNLIRNLHIAWLQPTATLVPARLYNPDAQKDYLGHLSELAADFECLADDLKVLETKIVYGYREIAREPIIRRFSPRSEHHFASGLLSDWANSPLAKSDRSTFANFRDQRVTVACIEQGQIKFFNIFEYADAKDALYFVLLAYQQCGWSPAKTPLKVSGELTEDSAVYKQLYRFVKQPDFYDFGHSAGLIGPAMQHLPTHIYSDLLTIGTW